MQLQSVICVQAPPLYWWQSHLQVWVKHYLKAKHHTSIRTELCTWYPMKIFSIYLHGAYRHQELECCHTSKLPPALGSGSMLTYTGGSWTEGPKAPMRFKLFEFEDVTGLLDSNPEGLKRNNWAISCSHRTQQINNDTLENPNNSSTPNTINQLPLPLENEALVHVVCQVQVPMDGWPAPHIFRLFVILVEPLQAQIPVWLRAYMAISHGCWWI